ncbi:hypothetical protein C4K22_3554 [Pseudomonas chlororaphis subsp. aurantiaca]|nr:hypothetical protein C4K22_3554 [Pseudomonas chlororaphis subsp. aurantiaca]AZD42636.1 hypothetical protein C4K21_3562 [Pseudomonas chlororaphis subsp. aurantiaca]AZD48901.1 hypothetical protein C4K20_3486 [Pseudomonas chlororaphis subsp. aurantiaca]
MGLPSVRSAREVINRSSQWKTAAAGRLSDIPRACSGGLLLFVARR